MAKKLQSAPLLLRKLRQEGGWISRFSWSPDGNEIGAGSQGGFVNVWDVHTGRRRLAVGLKADHVFDFIWHPDGKRFLTSDDVGRISVWDAREGALIKHINVPEKIRSRTRYKKDDGRRHVQGLALLSDGRRVVAGGPFGILLWEIDTGMLLHHVVEQPDIITLAVSPDGRRLASTSYDGGVCIWNTADFRVERRVPSTYSCALAWSPDGKTVAITRENSIVLSDAKSGRATHVLEGHTTMPRALAFSSDGKLFASRAGEHTEWKKKKRIDKKIMIWRTSTWDLHAVIEETAGWYLFTGLAFAPGTHRLATTAEGDRAIHVWDTGSSQSARRRYFPVFYKNAKVALVGDSGVGKSGLALVLTGRRFAATHSTHARRVTVLRTEKVKVGTKRNEVRETVLWDLAGQPGYRLIHQLHLDDVALALIVFDSRDERDPFAGARHWNRVLLNARLASSQVGTPPKRMLVAARIDRGPVSVSKTRVDEFCDELGIDCGYAETSAKENLGIRPLLSAIEKNATLVVRLSHSGFYRLKALWRNAATFQSGVPGVFGVFLSDLGEGVGKMTIFYDSVTDHSAKEQFEDYITTHLVRRALPSTVKKRSIVICPSPGCNTPVSEVSVDRRRERGLDWIACNVCDTRIPLTSDTATAEVSAESVDIVRDIDTSAEDHRQMDAALLAASGEMQTPVFKKWIAADTGTIALVFTDVVGSTAMAVELGDESMEQVRRKHFGNAYLAAQRNDGKVIKTIGDAFMVAFRTAVKALNFALDLKACTGHERVKIRAGIHVGPVHVTEGDVFGTMVNYTSRVVSYVRDAEI